MKITLEWNDTDNQWIFEDRFCEEIPQEHLRAILDSGGEYSLDMHRAAKVRLYV